ncbi:MAG: ABC transporter permease [Solirubrobacteraceae bacterium]
MGRLDARSLLAQHRFLFALALAVILLAANVVAAPSFGEPSNLSDTLGVFAPFALAAMAGTPSILSGGGGLDLSIGPLMSLVNVVLVVGLMPNGLGSPAVAVPLVLVLGAAVGAADGFLVSGLRYQPVIATLCALFVIVGVNLKIAPSPVIAPRGNWTVELAHSVGPVPGAVVTVGAVALLWLALRRTAYYRALVAVGGNDAAAFSAGVNIVAVRTVAYALGGAMAAVGGLALTGLVQTADANLGTQYVLIALAAIAVGGTQFAGGRGGLLGSALGAAMIYLLQNLLSALSVSALWLQVVYGVVLLVAVIAGARLTEPQVRPA